MVSDKVETDVPVDGNINKFSVSTLPNTPVSLGPWNPDFRVVGSEKKRERGVIRII